MFAVKTTRLSRRTLFHDVQEPYIPFTLGNFIMSFDHQCNNTKKSQHGLNQRWEYASQKVALFIFHCKLHRNNGWYHKSVLYILIKTAHKKDLCKPNVLFPSSNCCDSRDKCWHRCEVTDINFPVAAPAARGRLTINTICTASLSHLLRY